MHKFYLYVGNTSSLEFEGLTHRLGQSGPFGSPHSEGRASNCVISSLSEPEDKPMPC